MSSPAPARTVPPESLVALTSAPAKTCDTAPRERLAEPAGGLLALLAEFETPLLRYAVRLLGDLESARDVVQETFLRACQEDPSRVGGHWDRWLFRVCRNRAFDVQRKEHRMSIAEETTLQSLPGGEGPAETLAARETNSRLLIVLEGLPAGQQEVIRLKFQNNLKYREIAEITGHSEANVGFMLHTGLKRLRELMRDHQ